jgi:hypothetical protein
MVELVEGRARLGARGCGHLCIGGARGGRYKGEHGNTSRHGRIGCRHKDWGQCGPGNLLNRIIDKQHYLVG